MNRKKQRNPVRTKLHTKTAFKATCFICVENTSTLNGRHLCDAYQRMNDVERARFDRESCLFIYYAIELGPVHAYFGNEVGQRVTLTTAQF